MALTKEDLQAIGELIDNKLEPIRDELGSVKGQLGEVHTRLVSVELTQENKILPSIQLLAEGHGALVEAIKPLQPLPEKMDELQETVAVLKYVFKEHGHD